MNKDCASLSADKESGGSKPKKVVGKLVKKSPAAKKPHGKELLKKKRVSKSENVMVKKSRSGLLIELQPKELVKIVIDYFNDNFLPFIVSMHTWTLIHRPLIAVDGARVYVLTDSEGLKGLNHSFANIKEDERRLIEFGDSRWSDYRQPSSSHNGQYVSFSHKDKVTATNIGWQPKRSTKWLIKDNESEGGRFKCITFDGENSDGGVFSRDGQTLCSYKHGVNPITCIYRARGEAGKDLLGLMKLELNGIALAVSGNWQSCHGGK